MGLFTTKGENLGIDSLTIGVSRAGMEEYRESLKMHLLEETKTKLEDVAEIQTAIDNGWQGQARDQFLVDFDQQIGKIIEDLQKEYDDLDHRLIELSENYLNQDMNMLSGE